MADDFKHQRVEQGPWGLALRFCAVPELARLECCCRDFLSDRPGRLTRAETYQLASGTDLRTVPAFLVRGAVLRLEIAGRVDRFEVINPIRRGFDYVSLDQDHFFANRFLKIFMLHDEAFLRSIEVTEVCRGDPDPRHPWKTPVITWHTRAPAH